MPGSLCGGPGATTLAPETQRLEGLSRHGLTSQYMCLSEKATGQSSTAKLYCRARKQGRARCSRCCINTVPLCSMRSKPLKFFHHICGPVSLSTAALHAAPIRCSFKQSLCRPGSAVAGVCLTCFNCTWGGSHCGRSAAASRYLHTDRSGSGHSVRGQVCLLILLLLCCLQDT